ncbi:pleiomorphic adenoma gene X [Xyrauchen texanus]|uniref:pleiomorphic adenoma gene X n=1 Tax=Xyrauchen texanus TaxID=154827 RepID=UPI002242C555|nr:pleiomorphic adenoma gene X [Xyrauchen texanus]XP_051947450.1 pleiomorphic adenoma gene X [Xyrauchen texanus]
MFHGKEQLNIHLQTHDPNKQELRCEECGKHYNTRLGLKRHVATHATSVTGDLTCKVCRQVYESMSALLEHLSTHTGRPPPGTVVRERKHQCERCGRRFFTRKDVRRHAVVHTGRRDFLCPRCAQRFGRRDHLTRHLKKSHAQELETLNSMPIKEEPSPTMCSVGSPKDATEAFSMGMFNPQGLPSASISGVNHNHSVVSGPLSNPMGVGCYLDPSKPQPQQYQQAHRYQPSSTTSYLKVEMENFLTELQCGPMPPQAAVATTVARPGDLLPECLAGQSAHFTLRNSAFTSAEPPSNSANMDLSHLLGFLPFGLPPYSTPLNSGSLVMGYSTPTTAASPSPTSQLSGPFTSFQPQSLHEPQASGHLNQLSGFSPTLPRFHQAFQQ